MLRVLIGVLMGMSAGLVLAEADASRGEGLTTVCVACHGTDGNSPAGAFPSIAGQNANYLLKQLREIKSDIREVPVMKGMLDNLSEQDLADIAAYYASQEIKGGAARADLVALGETIYRSGIKRKKIAACTACHAPDGSGVDAARFPALAGQWPDYTEQQLKAFRSGARHNDGDARMMRGTAMDLSDEEIAAVASYIYGLR